MENFDAVGMECIAVYSPVRIALLGLVRTIFGLLIGIMAAVAIWATLGGEMKPKNPGDMPEWWMFLVGAGLAFAAFCFVTGGVGRMLSAFARDCYFRAGPEGIAVRLPRNGWFGRYKMITHRLGWDQVKQFVHFTHRVNFIPVSTELRIVLYSGGVIVIERHFFSAGVKAIQRKLLTIQAVAAQ